MSMEDDTSGGTTPLTDLLPPEDVWPVVIEMAGGNCYEIAEAMTAASGNKRFTRESTVRHWYERRDSQGKLHPPAPTYWKIVDFVTAYPWALPYLFPVFGQTGPLQQMQQPVPVETAKAVQDRKAM